LSLAPPAELHDPEFGRENTSVLELRIGQSVRAVSRREGEPSSRWQSHHIAQRGGAGVPRAFAKPIPVTSPGSVRICRGEHRRVRGARRELHVVQMRRLIQHHVQLVPVRELELKLRVREMLVCAPLER
jgi:hypothetical protein